MFIKTILRCSNKRVLCLNRYYSSRNIISLKDRGMWQDIFPDNSVGEVRDILNSSPQWVYAGFDPTASSLHIGNLLVLVNLLHWQRGGHNVLALLGGATGRIGDPSGRNTEREKLNGVFLDDNIVGIKENIQAIFDNHEKYFCGNLNRKLGNLRVVNNEDWYNKMSPVELLGDAGRFLRMGTLLSRTSVQSRLQSPAGMSLTEFSYQLFQAYDWLHLYKEFGCRFQVGGGDQMGNIMSGHELISKACKQSVFGLTLPLITTEMGDKFGKSAGNAIWLSSEKTSPFNLYQFWVRMSDADAEKMLKLFTFDTTGSIEDLMRKHMEKPELRMAQKRLAEQVTLLVHGEDGLGSALAASKALYEGNIEALGHMKTNEIAALFQGAEIVEIMPSARETVMELSMRVGCFPSKQDAVRIITAGGFSVNQQRAKNPNEILSHSVHRLTNDVTLLRVGKKNYYIVKWV
ncbi:PREDICTED: tyrosine--tRNA ligase, mitochondrial [Nicrophorus vespilloides]|uniref:Tyrosine--tRNA ligase n=1 Tax=Nicrophorus vespilloides TaxID=110193 RepID=A0ABM1M1G9_NICVS|nr:PREDICTED: tyrosine--tRNA ligase, mitochondrial [Nicrophorus vespilloides]